MQIPKRRRIITNEHSCWDWGGKFQSQEIKNRIKCWFALESFVGAELLDLKQTMMEFWVQYRASLKKRAGYVTKVLAWNLEVGDIVVAGCFHGKVKQCLTKEINS